MSLPVVALVGRPNVGKSTLFNVLTRTRSALVADFSGLTRDRQYGSGKLGPKPYLVVDTGGLGEEAEELDGMVAEQAWHAASEADIVMFMVDGRAGLSAADQDIAERLRRLGNIVYLVVNKTEHLDPDTVASEFHSLGLGTPHTISASHKRGVDNLLMLVFENLPGAEESEKAAIDSDSIRLAIVGRPNVGKSTLVNRLLGENRVLAYDMPGTTRDSVEVPFVHKRQSYTLIDTAGVRRRARVNETIEKFSVIKTLQSIEGSNVVIMMLDARQGISDQDAHLLGFIVDSGRALVIAVNKWDGMTQDERDRVKIELKRKLSFVDYAKIHYIAALHGSGIIDLFDSVRIAYASATRDLSTPELTRILEDAVVEHSPPLVHGHNIKLRYAHQGGQNPPIIVIHGNRVESVPVSYTRYLVNLYRKVLKLSGTPIRVEFRGSKNPYAPPPRKGKPRKNPDAKREHARNK